MASQEHGFKIEDIIAELNQDVNSGKYKGLQEACEKASDLLQSWYDKSCFYDAYALRDVCFLPFKIALESGSTKLATLAISGFQKIFADDRFQTDGREENIEDQFSVQFLNAITAVPSQSDEAQIEVMKLLLRLVNPKTCDLHGPNLVKMAEICVQTFVKAISPSTKSACRATLTEMLSTVCQLFQECMHNRHSSDLKGVGNISTDTSKVLSHDIVMLLKDFSLKLQQPNTATPLLHQSQALQLHLDSIELILYNLSTSMQEDKEFVNLIWQVLCPALIQLLGSPINDINTRNRQIGLTNGFPDDGRGARGMSTNKSLNPVMARTIYVIAGELVRLVGALNSLRPTLESLFHRIVLYSQPQHRIEALKVIQEILGSPQRIFDLAGPTIDDREPGTPESPTDQRKTDLDLFRLIMDGIQESSNQSDPSVSNASVSCVVALLGTLEDLSNGRGLSDENIEMLHKVKEPLNIQELSGKAVLYDNGMAPTLKCSSLDSGESEAESDEERPSKSKHIRWQMDYEENEYNSTFEDDDVILPKSVSWAEHNEERIIENREMMANPQKYKNKIGVPSDQQQQFPDSDIFGVLPQPIKPIAKPLPKDSNKKKIEIENTSPSKETTINGIPLSKIQRQKASQSKKSAKKPNSLKLKQTPPKEGQASSPKKSSIKADSPKKTSAKTPEELEKEGARNFARCLLGILPSVLKATEPSAADELLQQFASDVCEAVTCMTLKRKNVPNFGTVRTLDMKTAEENGKETNDPSLNAECVYKAVYEALKLSYELNQLGYYEKSGATPHVSQNSFIQSVVDFGFPVRLSRTWLSEVYRLITTYDILSKAGYHPESSDTNRALIGILSEKIYTHHPNRIKETDEIGTSGKFRDPITAGKREGQKFARRLLLSTWDQVLDTLAVPLSSTTQISSDSAGMKFLINNTNVNNRAELQSKQMLERDLVCLSLDGFRRAARLCCDLDIQSRCDIILSRLSEASCGYFINEKKQLSKNGIPPSVKLHAAHVLSMDALLAAGLELGSRAPQAWNHVFRCCMYISNLEHASFDSPTGGSSPNYPPAPPSGAHPHLQLQLQKSNILSPDYYSTDEDSDMSPDSTNSFPDDRNLSNSRANTSLTLNGILPAEDACRAVFALSSAVDNLFDMAATTLPLKAFREFLASLVEASHDQLFSDQAKLSERPLDKAAIKETLISMNTLHLYHICDVMLRCARNNTRPLLHVMEAWSIISSHLVEAAYSKEKHISKVALTSIHDILSELLKRRNELPHFWFYDALFKPFETLMSADGCEDDIHDQILYTLYELVEGFGPSIKSGWRSLFNAVSHAQIDNRSNLNDFNDGEQRRKLVFNMIEHFVQLKTTNVFSSSVVSAVLCLLKFIRGGREFTNTSEDSFDFPPCLDDPRSDTDSQSSEPSPEHDLCEPSLDILLQISKRLSTIYLQPSSVIFHGSYSILLVNIAESHDKVWDDNWSCGSSTTTSPDAESKPAILSTANSIVAIDDTGVLRIWFLILEGLTSSVANSPKRYQPMIIQSFFEILNSLTAVPGPHFSMFAISNLLLPMLQAWVERGARKKTYWDYTLNNFKHACGLATQLVADEIGHFLEVEGAVECVPLMLKQLLDLFHDCVSQHIEVIARLGCSCLRHLLLSAGSQFTEELWHILCLGIKQIVDSTLSQTRQLIDCFVPNSKSVTGDNGFQVKIVARRDVTPTESLRALQLAEQVFLLESQLTVTSPRSESDLDEDDNRSYIFLISPMDDKKKDEKIRVPFRSLTISLLSNQILIQMLGSILLESADSAVHGSIISTITEAGLIKRINEEKSLPGLLNYLSPLNLNILFGCLLDTHDVAHEFNTRPGLRSLTQKLGRFHVPANLLRTSITSFAFYLNTLFQISKYDGEHFSISNTKRILTGEKVLLEVVSPESPHKSSINPAKLELLKNSENIDWVIRRLHEACNQISTMYHKLHQTETFIEQDSGFIDNSSSTLSTPQASPHKNLSDVSEESLDVSRLMKGAYIDKKSSPFRLRKRGGQLDTQSTDSSSTKMNLIDPKKREDDLLHLTSWSQLIISMLDLLLGLPTLQFKSVLPAVFPAVTSLITTVHEPKVRQLVCDVVRRCGSIYGIL
ncbi:brefeldin A-inhibited guanine nucleotide-exchange protein 3-like isoform X2 [Clytia hemisphaerica]|uniref:brefeldin A-inhibited guanine nucleotide-exchange protein 3-like isoform X2 n=1 Tax=Clytia hemisphaerica TaxID=252671 RepID=UPI0034D70071